MIVEIWKDIEGFEGHYKISNTGKVKSLTRKVTVMKTFKAIRKERILKYGSTSNGYLTADLFKSNKGNKITIHRLVAKAFIPNILNKPMVNHINGNKKDNRVENLEWVTGSENNLHAFKLGISNVEGRLILNIQNGIYYQSIAEAARTINHGRRSLNDKLLRKLKNNTSLIYA